MHIEGMRIGERLRVVVDGADLSPARSQALWNHSPDGFECGYAGSGPAQPLEAGASATQAVEQHQRFKLEHVAQWQAPFIVDLDVETWLAATR